MQVSVYRHLRITLTHIFHVICNSDPFSSLQLLGVKPELLALQTYIKVNPEKNNEVVLVFS